MKGFRTHDKRKANLYKKINDALDFLAKQGVNARALARELGLTKRPLPDLTTKQLTGVLSRLTQFEP